MRVHTALHLMCALVPYPVTGGQIGEDGGRLDFDIDNPDAIDKDELTAKLQELVAADHKVSQRWITDAELDANPGLVRTMSVQPPRGSGKVRLVAIGEDGAVDLQPCGGTHVASTAEIGNISITKVEKKGATTAVSGWPLPIDEVTQTQRGWGDMPDLMDERKHLVSTHWLAPAGRTRHRDRGCVLLPARCRA
jgi:hypothetical protein